ncbi:MAG TPA: hypothetical protein PJ990_11655 [Saprospiraceae bacterium]|nr:hypothetical protein [Saprospiraceae bacterium]
MSPLLTFVVPLGGALYVRVAEVTVIFGDVALRERSAPGHTGSYSNEIP